jgi:hypothetical protein
MSDVQVSVKCKQEGDNSLLPPFSPCGCNIFIFCLPTIHICAFSNLFFFIYICFESEGPFFCLLFFILIFQSHVHSVPTLHRPIIFSFFFCFISYLSCFLFFFLKRNLWLLLQFCSILLDVRLTDKMCLRYFDGHFFFEVMENEAFVLSLQKSAQAATDASDAKNASINEMSSSITFNKNKFSEYGYEGALNPEKTFSVSPVAYSTTGSTLSEVQKSEKFGNRAIKGINATIGSLDHVRVDSLERQMTTNQGVAVADNQHSLKGGLRGPALLEDFILREKITHFDHERIPERVVHARGSGAYGFFEVSSAFFYYCKEKVNFRFSSATRIRVT